MQKMTDAEKKADLWMAFSLGGGFVLLGGWLVCQGITSSDAPPTNPGVRHLNALPALFYVLGGEKGLNLFLVLSGAVMILIGIGALWSTLREHWRGG